jgi:hypothetical protein
MTWQQQYNHLTSLTKCRYLLLFHASVSLCFAVAVYPSTIIHMDCLKSPSLQLKKLQNICGPGPDNTGPRQPSLQPKPILSFVVS